jgi:putative ATP-dependent endonuclease of OLD family
LYLNPRNGSERVARGLGYNNLLFMAAELLLLQTHPEQVPFLLIEEPEAHLHPQHQTLFMQVLAARVAEPPDSEKSKRNQRVQILLSTHSPQLASSAELETLTVVVGHRVYPLAKEQTKLDDDDYEFLRRFLDATKANLFFARGLIIVEGDAENLLLPAIAEKIGRPLGRHGVSLVNVGHRGLFRYSRIFQRVDGAKLPIPTALIPDRDIPPKEAKALVADRDTEDQVKPEELAAHIAATKGDEGGCVKVFISDQWTLEFDLARKPDLALLVHQAVKLAKTTAKRTPDLVARIIKDAATEYAGWKADVSKTQDDIATSIFAPLFKKAVSKAQTAEQLAKLIRDLSDDESTFRAKLPTYLVEAIDYATGKSFAQSAPPAEQPPAQPRRAPAAVEARR